MDILAAAVDSPIYLQPFKLLAVALVFVAWALFAQWVDKDTIAVNTYRVLWNLVTLIVGPVGIIAGLLIPNFLVGFLVMGAIVGGLIGFYVAHRNALVEPQDTVFTASHFRRIQETGFSGKKKKPVKEVKEKVKLTRADRKGIAIPEEEQAREQYALAQDVFYDGLWRRASRIDVSPAGDTAKVTYIVDALPVEHEPLPREEADSFIAFVKQHAGLNLEERRKPQDGRLYAAIGEHKFELRVRTNGSTAGERLTVRVIGPEAKFKITDLGFNPKQLDQVRALMDAGRGLTLLTGPAGSGVTTTCYSFTRSHDAFLMNIQLLEYNKELEIDNVTQNLYQPTEGRSFADELLRIIRADPDILIIPELRDNTAPAVIAKAASEKQKIYLALPANDVYEGLRKWSKLVPDKGHAAKSVNAVINQRLIRKLCTACRESYKPDAQTLRKLNLPPDAVLYRQPQPQFDKRGNPIICPGCQGSGYSGLTGVFDILVVDEGLREVVRRGGSTADIQTYVAKKGGVGLQPQALEKVLSGITSIQEVVRVVRGAPAKEAPTGGEGQPVATKPRPAGSAGSPAA